MIVAFGFGLPVLHSTAGTPDVSVFDRLDPPRSGGMGGAGAALGGDPGLVWLNPAATAEARSSSISVNGGRGGFGELTGAMCGSLAMGRGTCTLAAGWYDAGTVNANTSDGSTVRFNTRQDLALMLGYAGNVTPRIGIGASVKYLRAELADLFASHQVLADAGAQFRLTEFVELGGSVRNAGPAARFAGDTAPLPVAVRVGGTVGWRPGLMHSPAGNASDALLATADLESTVITRRAWLHAGVEYRLGVLFSIRGGWRSGPAGSLGGPTAGLSAALTRPQGNGFVRYRIDYAMDFVAGMFERAQTAGLTVEWSLPDL